MDSPNSFKVIRGFIILCFVAFLVVPCGAKYVWRTKRATQEKSSVFPGTKWCGLGNNARSYDDLGQHKKTDMCCRDHDHCPNYIGPFRRKFNLFNFSPFTMFDCKCENKFYECLWNIQDPVATVVGKLYFNWIKVLRGKCFNLVQDSCKAEFSWLHMRNICVRNGFKLVAKTSRLRKFNKPYPGHVNNVTSSVVSTPTNPPLKRTTVKQRLRNQSRTDSLP